MLAELKDLAIEELKKEVGKYILCEAREDNATRLYINRFNEYHYATTKQGKYDTFTVTPKPAQKGYHICTIDDIKNDAASNPIIVATSIKYIGVDPKVDCIAWRFLLESEKFSTQYCVVPMVSFSTYNPENINEVYAMEPEFKDGDQDIYNYVLSKYLSDEAPLKHLELLLTKPTKTERIVIDLVNNRYAHSFDYPLLVKKMPRGESLMSDAHYYSVPVVMDYITRKNIEYYKLGLGEETNILARVEAVLKYWDEFHKKEKEDKKAARKNKK